GPDVAARWTSKKSWSLSQCRSRRSTVATALFRAAFFCGDVLRGVPEILLKSSSKLEVSMPPCGRTEGRAWVEAITEVDADQSHGRDLHAGPNTERSFEIEEIGVCKIGPDVSGLRKREKIDRDRFETDDKPK